VWWCEIRPGRESDGVVTCQHQGGTLGPLDPWTLGPLDPWTLNPRGASRRPAQTAIARLQATPTPPSQTPKKTDVKMVQRHLTTCLRVPTRTNKFQNSFEYPPITPQRQGFQTPNVNRSHLVDVSNMTPGMLYMLRPNAGTEFNDENDGLTPPTAVVAGEQGELFVNNFLGIPEQCNIIVGGIFAGVGQVGDVDDDGKLNVFIAAPERPIGVNICPVPNCLHFFPECTESILETKETMGVKCHILNHLKRHKKLTVCPWDDCQFQVKTGYHFANHVLSKHHNGLQHFHHAECGKFFSSPKNYQGHCCFASKPTNDS
jgi:hypothetical protein